MRALRIAVGMLAVVVAAGVVLENRAQRRLRTENEMLGAAVERLSRVGEESPRVIGQPQSKGSLAEEQFRELLRVRGEAGVRRQEAEELERLRAENGRLHTNWVEKLLGGKRLSVAEVAPYLAAKQRSAESLVAAFRATGDTILLREALERYPNDPRVNFSALFQSYTAEERRERLEALKELAPENALGDYLSAREHLKAGQTEEGIEEVAAAAGKAKFEDYSRDFVENLEEVYESAGCTKLEAKAVAALSLPLPQFAELRGLCESLSELANGYRRAGDEASAQVLLEMGVGMGRRVGEGSGQTLLIQDLVAIGMQLKFLSAMDPASAYGDGGQTVRDRLEELGRFRQEIKELAGGGGGTIEVLRGLSDEDRISFFDRIKASGELEALRWARDRQGKR